MNVALLSLYFLEINLYYYYYHHYYNIHIHSTCTAQAWSSHVWRLNAAQLRVARLQYMLRLPALSEKAIYIHYLWNICSFRLYALRVLKNVRLKDLLILVYCALIHSFMDYACPAIFTLNLFCIKMIGIFSELCIIHYMLSSGRQL